MNAFDERAEDYDRWFEDHAELYQAELAAVSELLVPVQTRTGPGTAGLEIGAGTGRFAAALGIEHGIEPAPRMAQRARRRGIDVTEDIAEKLPFPDNHFAYTLFVTSLCFVTDPERALLEARRVTIDDGAIVIAYLNRASPPGRDLAAHQADDPYYAHAQLRSTGELQDLLERAGLTIDSSRQVLKAPNKDGWTVAPGADTGLFCVLRTHSHQNHSP